PIILVAPKCEPESFKPRGRIVVPVDGSETSTDILALAASWAIAYEMDPQVVTVIDPRVEAAIGVPINVATEANLPSGVAAGLRTEIGRNVDWEVLHSENVADAIADRARDVGASIIAMSTHGRTGLPRVVMGSVTMAVVHKATCPVLVHRPLRLPT
ncbi:MAG: universal stress protein, partial [Acidimicrobiales bacterium]